MEKKRKFGWTALGIIGMAFAPMGAIFMALGIAFRHFGVGKSAEDPEIFLLVFGGVGLIFLLIGLGLLYADLRRRARMRRAYEGGYYVMAKVAGIRQKRNVSINGQNPFQVEAHYTDPGTGVVHVYYSRYLYTDVSGLLTSDEVPVYLDRSDDTGTGFVDIDAILPEIRVHG